MSTLCRLYVAFMSTLCRLCVDAASLLLFCVEENGNLLVATDETEMLPGPGQKLVALVDKQDLGPEILDRNFGLASG